MFTGFGSKQNHFKKTGGLWSYHEGSEMKLVSYNGGNIMVFKGQNKCDCWDNHAILFPYLATWVMAFVVV